MQQKHNKKLQKYVLLRGSFALSLRYSINAPLHKTPLSLGVNKISMITKAKPQDAPIISDIAMRSKAYWGYDEVFMTQVKAELTYCAEDIQQHLTFIATKESVIIGFYQLIHVDEKTVELDALFIELDYIGQGMGNQLFDHAADSARQQGYQTMSLQSEPYAEDFYIKKGCVKTGEQPSLSIPGRVLPAMIFNLVWSIFQSIKLLDIFQQQQGTLFNFNSVIGIGQFAHGIGDGYPPTHVTSTELRGHWYQIAHQ